jgi:hypothetical protein
VLLKDREINNRVIPREALISQSFVSSRSISSSPLQIAFFAFAFSSADSGVWLRACGEPGVDSGPWIDSSFGFDSISEARLLLEFFAEPD